MVMGLRSGVSFIWKSLCAWALWVSLCRFWVPNPALGDPGAVTSWISDGTVRRENKFLCLIPEGFIPTAALWDSVLSSGNGGSPSRIPWGLSKFSWEWRQEEKNKAEERETKLGFSSCHSWVGKACWESFLDIWWQWQGEETYKKWRACSSFQAIFLLYGAF